VRFDKTPVPISRLRRVDGSGEASEAQKEDEEEENEKEATAVVSCEMAIPLDRNHP